jgi:DNA-binding NarL/FixJ family response regulator
MAVTDLPSLPLPTDKLASIVAKLDLSPQQARVVELILRNCCDKEIAAAMQLKVSTVRTYLSRLFARLGVENRVALVLKIFLESHAVDGNGCHRN